MAEDEQEEVDKELEEIYLCVKKMIFLFDTIYHLYTCMLGYSLESYALEWNISG